MLTLSIPVPSSFSALTPLVGSSDLQNVVSEMTYNVSSGTLNSALSNLSFFAKNITNVSMFQSCRIRKKFTFIHIESNKMKLLASLLTYFHCFCFLVQFVVLKMHCQK